MGQQFHGFEYEQQGICTKKRLKMKTMQLDKMMTISDLIKTMAGIIKIDKYNKPLKSGIYFGTNKKGILQKDCSDLFF